MPGPALAALAARTVLPLTGLTVEAVTELIGGVVGEQRAGDIAADVHRRTGGNPFFAQQVSWLLKDGRTGMPPGAREALEQRFAALPEACSAVLRAAAVAGPRVSAGLVARVTGGSPDAVAGLLADAVQARVLSQDVPDGHRFVHDLFREFAAHAGSAGSTRHDDPGPASAAPWPPVRITPAVFPGPTPGPPNVAAVRPPTPQALPAGWRPAPRRWPGGSTWSRPFRAPPSRHWSAR